LVIVVPGPCEECPGFWELVLAWTGLTAEGSVENGRPGTAIRKSGA
jgi:hypothetical protein